MGDLIDPITMDPIPAHLLVSYTDQNATFNFNLETLTNWIETCNRYENPLNRQKLPDSIVSIIKAYQKESIKEVVVSSAYFSGFDSKVYFPIYKKLGDLIFSLFADSKISMIIRSVLSVNYRNLWNLDLESPLNKYDFEYPLKITIHEISLSGKVKQVDDILCKAYKYAVDHHMDYIIKLIPESNQVLVEPPVDQADPQSYLKFQALVQNISLFSIDETVRMFLAVSDKAFITASQAQELEQKIYEALLGQEGIYLLAHVLYSRVVDKFNLKEAVGVQGYYARGRKIKTDYSINCYAAEFKEYVK